MMNFFLNNSFFLDYSLGVILLFVFSIFRNIKNKYYLKFALSTLFLSAYYFIRSVEIDDGTLFVPKFICIYLFILSLLSFCIEKINLTRTTNTIILFVTGFLIFIIPGGSDFLYNYYETISGLLIFLFFPYIFLKLSKREPSKKSNFLMIGVVFLLIITSMIMHNITKNILYDVIFFILIAVNCLLTILSVNGFLFFKKNGDIRKSLLSLLYFVFITILIFSSFFITNQIDQNSYSKINKDLKEDSKIIVEKIENSVKYLKRVVKMLAEEENIKAFTSYGYSWHRNKSNNIIDLYRDVFDLDLVYILDREGNVLLTTNRDSKDSILDENFSFRPYFSQAFEKYSSDYLAVGVTTGKRGYYCSSAILKNAYVNGVVVVKKNISFLDNSMEYDTPFFFINEDGIVLVSNHKDALLKSVYNISEHKKEEILKSRQFTGVDFSNSVKILDDNFLIFKDKKYRYKKNQTLLNGWSIITLHDLSLITNNRYFSVTIVIIMTILIMVFYGAFLKEDSYLKTILDSEKRYRTLFENSPNMIALLNKSFNFLEVNRKFSWVSGNIPGKVPNKELFGFWKNEKKEEINKIKLRILEGNTFVKEIDFFTDNKDYKRLLIMLSPIDENIIFIGVDITEERRMEQELFEEQEKLSVTLDAIDEGVISTDKDGKVIIMNKAARKMADVDLNIIGKRFVDVIDLKIKEKIFDPVSEVISTENNVIKIHDVTIGKNNVPVIINAAPVFDNYTNINGMVMAIRDVRYEKKVEEEMINLQKLESISLFAAGIAHDFNNILTSILGNISIASNMNKDEKLGHMLRNAENACKNAKDLTMQLLTFAKGEQPDKELVNAEKLIRETADFSIRGSNCSMVMDIDNDLKDFEVESGKIKQVINNVIINSSQAMKDGGTIYVKAENIYFDEEYHGLISGDYIKISIRDTGSGINQEDLKKIFDPYFTTKKEGTGLGLATVLAIVKNHDGIVEVSSEINHGTTFDIYLPSSSKEIIKEQVLKEENDFEYVKGKVLVMDDEKDVREVTRIMLQEIGFEVSCVEKGEDVIELLEQGNNYDIILMDLTIRGGMGGIETIKIIRDKYPDCKVIVSSGYSKHSINNTYEKHGFSGFISKPFTMDDLSVTINKVIKK